MTKNTIVYLDKAALDKAISSIAKRAATLDADIQQAGLSCLKHLADHGDVGFVNRLYLALGKGNRKAALSSWFLAYGQLVANTGDNKKEMPFKYTKDKEATDLQGAAIDPWFDHKPDADPDQVFDVRKALEGIIKKAAGKKLVHGELISSLQSLVMEPVGTSEPTGDADEGKSE